MAFRQHFQTHPTNQENSKSRFNSTLTTTESHRIGEVNNRSQAIPKSSSGKNGGALLDPNENRGQKSNLLLQNDRLQRAMPPSAKKSSLKKRGSVGHKRARHVTFQEPEVAEIKRMRMTTRFGIANGKSEHKEADGSNDFNNPRDLSAIVSSSLLDTQKNALKELALWVTSQESESSGKTIEITTRSGIVKQGSVSEHKEPDGNDDVSDSGTLSANAQTSKSHSSCRSEVPDPDKEITKDPIMVTEYASDIFEYLRSLEDKFPIKKDFLEGQAINPKMRMVLVDWVVNVHNDFKMLPETLYLCVSIIDRFMQENKKISGKYFQLVGIAALLVAAKYEEPHIPALQDFLFLCPDIYSRKKILTMERKILKELDFSLGRPLALQFLRRYNELAIVRAMHHALGKYILELALLKYELCHISPSLLAAAVCCLSIGILEEVEDLSTVWTAGLARRSGYKYCQLMEVIVILAELLIESESCRFQTTRTKYSSSKYMAISTCPLLKGFSLDKLIGGRMTTTFS